MTIPHNEITRKMAERVVACIPIIPPGQEDDAGEAAQSEKPKYDSDVREHYFEKHIRRVGGPPRPPKPKHLFSSEPAAVTTNSSDEWVHRAIEIAGQRR